MTALNYLKARQIKAARALLDWSQEDLAEKSGLSVATIRKQELGHISPRGLTIQSMRKAFENAGLEFIEPNGVRHRPDDIRVYQGEEAFFTFFDDVYDVAKKTGGEFNVVCESEVPFEKILGDYHIDRMMALKNGVTVKHLITKHIDRAYSFSYCQYRHLPKAYVECVPFYVYGDKLAIIIFDTDIAPRVTVLHSPSVAAEYRKMFASMWDKATTLGEKSRKQAR